MPNIAKGAEILRLGTIQGIPFKLVPARTDAFQFFGSEHVFGHFTALPENETFTWDDAGGAGIALWMVVKLVEENKQVIIDRFAPFQIPGVEIGFRVIGNDPSLVSVNTPHVQVYVLDSRLCGRNGIVARSVDPVNKLRRVRGRFAEHREGGPTKPALEVDMLAFFLGELGSKKF